MRGAVIVAPGLLTTLQDRGRYGHAASGVGTAGPMDAPAWRLANALVGNDANAAALEITLIGPRLRFECDTRIALTGAAFDARFAARAAPMWQTLHVSAGDVLDCGRPRHGTRAYLAIAGGFTVEPMLGSSAIDVNAQLGPFDGRALRAGDVLPTIAATGARAPHPTWSLDPRPWFDPDPATPIRLIRGTHFDALDASSRAALFDGVFHVASDSNRVGLRLDGPSLALAAPLELISAAVAFGTVQLPPGGQPIALMAEHPTTGGYPRVGQVAAVDLPLLAQRRPGEPVRFAEIGLDEAQTRYLEHERALARLLDAIAIRLAE